MSSPFWTLDQPMLRTVRATSEPSSSASCTGSDSSTRMRGVGEELTGHLERRDRLVARHRREGVEKVLDRVACFEVVDERAHRHASPDEHRSATESLGVAVDYFVSSHR